jgi:biopolymer transport protein TolQ
MESASLDIFQILLESGFVVKFVLFVLIACSVLSWALIFKKKKEFDAIEVDNKEFFTQFTNSTNLSEISGSSKIIENSTLSTMFDYGYEELSKIRENIQGENSKEELKNYIHNHGAMALERSLKQGANIAQDKMESRLSTLASIGSISPFIGLFGTVWGIIDSFAGLASGGGSIEAVAPGIAEALVATAVGLAAAIPAVWGYNIFNAKISRMNLQMESFGQQFLNLIERSILLEKK